MRTRTEPHNQENHQIVVRVSCKHGTIYAIGRQHTITTSHKHLYTLRLRKVNVKMLLGTALKGLLEFQHNMGTTFRPTHQLRMLASFNMVWYFLFYFFGKYDFLPVFKAQFSEILMMRTPFNTNSLECFLQDRSYQT